MRVFSIAGFSGTGKTTLVESIIRELMQRGYSVVTLKSSQHQPREEEGTDTDRHLKAGAEESYFYGPSSKGRSLKEIVDSTNRDYLIVEGMKTSAMPKCWCIGDRPLGDTIPSEVKAIVSWRPEDIDDKYALPILRPENIKQIVDLIETHAIEFAKIEEN